MTTASTDINEDLRRFQRATCARAAEVLLDRSEGPRFLVADEVGLGKTRVALGLIRELAARQRASRRGAVVVYLTANSEIAKQNVQVLQLGREPTRTLPSRITLLPLALKEVRAPGIHVLAFTPGTSLRLSRGTGTKTERALIVKLLRPLWRMGVGDNVLEVFRGAANLGENAKAGSGATGFRGSVEELDPVAVDAAISRRFRRAVAAHPELKQEFLRLKRECRDHGEVRDRRARNRLIGKLRELLAEASLAGLSPKLVILDEFQRFRWVLEDSLRDRTLAHRLLSDAPVLLLSATPYRMRPGGQELEAQQDFVTLLRFLFRDRPEAELASERFSDLALALRLVRSDSDEARARSVGRVRQAKLAVEDLLVRVMSRWERPVDHTSRGVTAPSLAVEAGDVAAYVAFQQGVNAAATDRLRHRETVEYWKSAPYLFNFMRGYRVKQAFLEAEQRRWGAAMRPIWSTPTAGISWRSVERYQAVGMPNARGRYLAELALNSGQWRALWVPPTLPPYELQGPFEGVRDGNATKMLVFSGWRVVPPALAGLIGYEAERRAVRGERNTPADRKRRSSRQLLSPAVKADARRTTDQVQRLAVLGLVYPSSVLAATVDPYQRQRESDALPTLVEVLTREARNLRSLMRQLPKQSARGRVDPRWYWATPMLLDQAAGVDVRTLIHRQLADVWSSDPDGESTSTSMWASLEQIDHVLTGEQPLGRRPGDLLRITTRLAVAGLGVCALRALSTAMSIESRQPPESVRVGAAEAAWGLRTMFNRPDATLVVRPRHRNPRTSPYWRDVLNYCCDGALQGVLDEYMHLLREQPEDAERKYDLARQIGRAVRKTTELQALRVDVDLPDKARTDNGAGPLRRKTLSSRFAAAFGASMTEEAAGIHPEVVRRTFNSPFWPWVLVTTSVGQEGLDFHRYCHSVVHWNVPATPVELEQREGRVQRYKSHYVRRNLAANHARGAIQATDPWRTLLRLGEESSSHSAEADFAPEWVFEGPFSVERHVPVPPYSRDKIRFDEVRKARVYYRMVLGQPNPDELVEVLMRNMPEEIARELVDELRLDLRPRQSA